MAEFQADIASMKCKAIAFHTLLIDTDKTEIRDSRPVTTNVKQLVQFQ